MTTHVFDYTQFITLFPEFSSIPQLTLQGYWNVAIIYINPNDNCFIPSDILQYMLNLMTAHLTQLSLIIAAGQTPYQLTGAGIDKVNVTLTPPPNPTQYQWWVGTTPYGAQLLALEQVLTAGGFFLAGLPEGSSFMKVGGIY